MVTLDAHEDMQRLANSGVAAVMHGADADTIIDVADTPHEGGAIAYEITADNPDAMDPIREVSASLSDNEAIVDVETAFDAPTASTVIRVGVEFVVGPNFDEGVAEICNRYGTLIVPDIMAPTEATDAYFAGADLVKVFSASSLGPGHLKSTKRSLSRVLMMPADGVGLDNAAGHIEAGAVVVGAGGALMGDETTENSDSEAIAETAREFSNIIDDARDD